MTLRANSNYLMLPQLQIQYVYYEVMNRSEMTENFMHAIRSEKIVECLEEKGYVLKKEDIIYLLKNDNVHFFEDSLRLFDDEERHFFQVPHDWELHVDPHYPVINLLFWVRSISPNFRRKIDDTNDNLKKVNNDLTERIKALERDFKVNLDKVCHELDNLKLARQIIFQQLVKIYERQVVPAPDDQSPLEPKKPFLTELETSVENLASSFRREDGRTIPPTAPGLGLGKLDDAFGQLEGSLSHRQEIPGGGSRGIDVALMYSEPLVKRDEYGIKSLGDPVDYEEECKKVLEILRKKEKNINLYFEIAAIKHLVNVVSLSPSVLHIICHGDFDKNRKQFYLCFEDNGELYELYSDELKSKLQEINFNTQLVFVNACHSEEVAKVFMEAGVPCVVAVHSELKIEDTIAQKFSESFYWQLFEGKTIEDAFRHARASITGKGVYTCCCAHSHKPGCEWEKMAKEEGVEKAHYLHTPTCIDCYNKFGNKFEHKDNCMWAMDFLTEVCKKDSFPQGTFHSCCCSEELPHNEVMKFKLIYKEDKFVKQPLFRYKEKGKVNIQSTYSCVEPKFSIQKITGRNREAYDLFEALISKNRRIINLHGPSGVGKSTLAKQVTNYAVERGYFRDKVILLTLEKIPSLSYFLTNLYNEIPGAVDLKSFCEAIKANKILIILEKCDKLSQDYFEQFRQDLGYILEYAREVKILTITNKVQNLQLGESHVLMRELKKIDAAKLLCKYAFLYLPWEERNIYNLENHGIFDVISLTPHGIWTLAEKLKNDPNTTLSDIEMELISEKEKNDDENFAMSKAEETIKFTLEELMNNLPEVYDFLVLVCLFPAGLSFQDLEELSAQNKIPSKWKETLLDFLRNKAISNQFQYELLETDSNASSDKRDRSDSKEAKGAKKIERSDFKPDNYIWINITKDSVDNEIWFTPTQFVIKYIEKYLAENIFDQAIKKFEYMAALTIGLIDKIKYNHDYLEKLLESSAVSNYGIWRVSEEQDPGYQTHQLRAKYLTGHGWDFEKLKRLFARHEPNFLSCLETKAIDFLVEKQPMGSQHARTIIEILCLGIPTLCKLVTLKESAAMEVARKAEQIASRLGENEVRTRVLKIKIGLFLVALHLGCKTDKDKNFQLAKIELRLIQGIQEKIRGSDYDDKIACEISLTKALYYYRGFKNKCLNSKELSNKFLTYKECNRELEKAENLLIPKLKDNVNNLKVLKAKITLAQNKVRWDKMNFPKKILDDMKESLTILKNYGSLKLFMKIEYEYASIRLDMVKSGMGIRNPESSPAEDMKKISKKLFEIKNNHLTKYALSVAKQIKDSIYEGKVKRKIDEVNMEIRHAYFNVIIIMRSSPIVDIKQTKALKSSSDLLENSGGSYIAPTGFPTRLASNFKNDVTRTLHQLNKVLCLKFEVLTKKELEDSLLNGCRVLQLTCSYTEEDCLCLEGPYGVVERMSFEELKKVFSPKISIERASITPGQRTSHSHSQLPDSNDLMTTSLHQHLGTMRSTGNSLMPRVSEDQRERAYSKEATSDESNMTFGNLTVQGAFLQETKVVDVLILAMKKNKALVDLFIELRIPHIIAFEFSNENFDFRHKTYEDECLERFSQYFYEELVLQKSIAQAYEVASAKTFDYLGEKFFEGKTKTYITRIIGRGPVLLPEDTDHSEVLFGVGRFPLAHGRPEDISSCRYPTNIEKMMIPFTGRNKDLYGVMRKVSDNCEFFKITGPSGIGKTAFVLQVGYHMLSRTMFPDGIFYIPLKKLKEKKDAEYEMKDLLRETLGLDIQSGFNTFFKAKNMLLIFDDFDLFYSREIDFPRLLFLTLKECKISCVLVTKSLNNNNGMKLAKKKQKAFEEYSIMKKNIEKELSIEKNAKWKLKGLSEEELALILQSLMKTNNHKEFFSLDELKKCSQIKHAQGNPKFIIDKLIEEKIEVQKKFLKFSPTYEKYLYFENEYLLSNKPSSSSSSLVALRRNSSNLSDMKAVGRSLSVTGNEISPQAWLFSPRQKLPSKGGERNLYQISSLQKSKSMKGGKEKEKNLNKSFDVGLQLGKKKEKPKRGNKNKKKRKTVEGGGGNSTPMLNQSIMSTGSVMEKGRLTIGSQHVIDEKQEDEKVETIESEHDIVGDDRIRKLNLEEASEIEKTYSRTSSLDSLDPELKKAQSYKEKRADYGLNLEGPELVEEEKKEEETEEHEDEEHDEDYDDEYSDEEDEDDEGGEYYEARIEITSQPEPSFDVGSEICAADLHHEYDEDGNALHIRGLRRLRSAAPVLGGFGRKGRKKYKGKPQKRTHRKFSYNS